MECCGRGCLFAHLENIVNEAAPKEFFVSGNNAKKSQSVGQNLFYFPKLFYLQMQTLNSVRVNFLVPRIGVCKDNSTKHTGERKNMQLILDYAVIKTCICKHIIF